MQHTTPKIHKNISLLQRTYGMKHATTTDRRIFCNFLLWNFRSSFCVGLSKFIIAHNRNTWGLLYNGASKPLKNPQSQTHKVITYQIVMPTSLPKNAYAQGKEYLFRRRRAWERNTEVQRAKVRSRGRHRSAEGGDLDQRTTTGPERPIEIEGISRSS